MFDNFLPPVLRDSKAFEAFLKLVLGRDNPLFGFKSRVIGMPMSEFVDCYRRIESMYARETDLNEACLGRILRDVTGACVLEVGAGSGYLAAKLASKYETTAVDMASRPKGAIPSSLKWITANCEDLPFEKDSFDTVICSHVLEHVLDFEKTLGELRRVARRRLIIVVPLQRPYRTTTDLHLHFFPYPESFLIRARPRHAYKFDVLDGDLYYVEDYTT